MFLVLKKNFYLFKQLLVPLLGSLPRQPPQYCCVCFRSRSSSKLVHQIRIVYSCNPANHQDISVGYGSIVIIQSCKKSKYRGPKNLEVRICGEILRGWNLQESLSANPISHCLIDFRGFVTGGKQGWDFTTQDLEAFLESSSIALKMALKESLASCGLISSTDFTLKLCLSMSRIQESYWFMCRKYTHLSGFTISGLESSNLLWFKMETFMQNSCFMQFITLGC